MDGSPNDCFESQGDDVQRKFIMPKRRLEKYPKLEPIKCEIDVSLEELLQGHIKKVPIERIVKYIDKEITVIKDFKVKIEPGVEAGTLVTFQQEGNNTLSEMLPGDVIFIINDKLHRFFKRINQCDIEHTAQVIHPIDGKSIDIKIPTLELNKEFEIISYEPNEIYKGSEKRILGGGLPKKEDNTQRGDLVIRLQLVEDSKVIHGAEAEKDDQVKEIRIYNPMKDNKKEHELTSRDKVNVSVVNKHKLWLSLNEVFSGCTKTKIIPIKKINELEEAIIEEKEFTIEIKPGVQTGHEITFEQQGDEQLDGSFADVVFVVHDVENVIFQRDGPNIKYVAKITHNQLKNNETISIPTLEDKKLKVILNDNFEQIKQKKFYRHGLPYPTDSKMRGILLVQFEIVTEQEAKECTIVEERKGTQEKNSTDEMDEEILAKNEENNNPNSSELNLELTLSEIYMGCTKPVKIPRSIICEENETIADITIEPGSFGGTKIYWPPNANREQIKGLSTNVVFTVVEKDSILTRSGYDIVYTAEVSTYDLFHKRTISIPTLNNNSEDLILSDEITNDTIRKIKNQGFPYHDKMGDLLVKFNITESPIDEPVQHDLYVKLEDIMFGKTKKVTIQKLLLDKNGNQYREAKILNVIVPPGTKSGKLIKFPRESDQYHGFIPADIIFKILMKKHDVFKRNGADIEYVAKVTQSELSREDTLEIPTLGCESETVKLYLENTFSQKSTPRIKSCGLPYHDNPEKRGDIVVRFEIIKEIKDPDYVVDVQLTLENILKGHKKNLEIDRKKLVKYGQTEDETIEVAIDIKPGTVAGTSYLSKNLGDENPGRIPADIVFIARDKPHVYFQRNGANIVHTELITREESRSCPLRLETPTLKENLFFIHDIKFFSSRSGYICKYTGFGLPKMDNPSKKGDLIVNYEIIDHLMKVPKLEIEVEISLEEVLHGHKNKEINFATTSMDLLGTSNQVKKKTYINVERGLKTRETFFCKRRGNRMPGHAPGDVWFICIDKPHPHFKRDGADLIYTAKITSKQAKMHFIDIPTLGKTTVTRKIENVTKDSTITIPQLGLPYYHDSTGRGNIIVKFEISNVEIPDSDYEILEKYSKNSQNPSMEINFFVSLETILNGSTELVKVPITKDYSNETSTSEFKEFQIEIKPGTRTGERFVFPQQGSQFPGKITSDVVCIMQVFQHEKFKRNEENIEYTQQIESRKKLLGKKINIPTLENEKIECEINKDNIEGLTIPGHGLPLPEDSTRRGNLVVRFEKPNSSNKDKKEPPKELFLNLTLNQILIGSKEVRHIEHTKKDNHGNIITSKSKTVNIEIKPGTETGRKIYFKYKKGQYHQNDNSGDVVFIVQELPHYCLKRSGDDLIYTKFLNLSEVQQVETIGLTIDVPTLEDTFESLYIKEIVNEEKPYPVKNLGLPNPNTKLRGDILVKLVKLHC